MSALHSYQQQNSRSWTRIDMLLALYDFGIRTAAAGIDALDSGNPQQLTQHRFKMQRVIIELMDGLDPEVSETSEPMHRLLHFVASSVSTDDPLVWKAAQRVLLSLREGFEQVREDAVRVEQSGAVAPAHGDARAVSTLA